MMKRQEGMTGISILIIIIMIVFVVSLAIKIVPVYTEDATIKNVVASFHNKGDMRNKSKKAVLKIFKKKLKINSVYDFDMDDVTLKKKDGDYLLVIDYEPRGEIVGSLEFIVHFRHEAKFASH